MALAADLASIEMSVDTIMASRMGEAQLLQMAMQKLQMVAARRLAVSSLQHKVPVRWLRSHDPTICLPPYLDVLSGAKVRTLMRVGAYDSGTYRKWRLETFSDCEAAVVRNAAACPLCNAVEASVEHLLLWCPTLQQLRQSTLQDLYVAGCATPPWAQCAVLTPSVLPSAHPSQWQDLWMRVLLGACTDAGVLTRAMAQEAGFAVVDRPDHLFRLPLVTVDLSAPAKDPPHIKRECIKVRRTVLEISGRYLVAVDRERRRALGHLAHL